MSKSKGGIASKSVVWGFLAVLVVSLAGFSVTNFGGSTSDIGRVGETPISARSYANALRSQMDAVSAQTGSPVTVPQAQQMGLDQIARVQATAQAALDDEAGRNGLSVGDAAVARAIRSIPGLADPEILNDRAAYQQALRRAGYTVSAFEDSLRRDATRSLLRQSLVEGVALPGSYADTLYSYINETRDLSWSRLSEADLTTPLAAPDDAALTDWYQAHEALYTAPETRQVTVALVTPEDLAAEVEVGDDTLRALYDERSAELSTPERRLVERLVFPDQTNAEAAAKALNDGAQSFDELVTARGLSLSDIDLGDATRTDLGSAAETVFALENPGLTGVVETDLGPAIFRVNAILPAQEVTFDEARDALRGEIARDRASRRIAEMREDLSDRLAGGATLEDLAQETSMRLETLDWTPDLRAGISAYPAIRESISLAEDGDFPDIAELDDGGLFALRLDAVTPPTLQPLDAVRDQVSADWRADATTKSLATQARAQIEGAEAQSLDGLFSFDQIPGITRQSGATSLPGAAIARAFTLSPGEADVVETEQGAIVLRVDAIHAADQGSTDAQALKRRLSLRAEEALREDLLAGFTRAVERDAGIRFDLNAARAVAATLR